MRYGLIVIFLLSTPFAKAALETGSIEKRCSLSADVGDDGVGTGYVICMNSAQWPQYTQAVRVTVSPTSDGRLAPPKGATISGSFANTSILGTYQVHGVTSYGPGGINHYGLVADNDKNLLQLAAPTDWADRNLKIERTDPRLGPNPNDQSTPVDLRSDRTAPLGTTVNSQTSDQQPFAPPPVY